ncbi:MAG TPA: hypothetical protein PLJ35_10290 [Anaerolineae bacterium]|nr:hypothetical protein [Anaerolineae bacterium]HOQ99194.1 hypothetical protein [Anaerolineae bacterium]HPL29072.1 hypothetical protein [Anaerolineae bacterium]
MTTRYTRRAFLRRSAGALAAAGLWHVCGAAAVQAAATPPPAAPLARDWPPQAVIIGVGGAGAKAISLLAARGVAGARLCVAECDVAAALQAPGAQRVLLGPQVARGLGAGGLVGRGEACALASAPELRDVLGGVGLALLVAGLGGGSGGGAGSVIARLAREAGAITIALVTLPFGFEGRRRWANAQAGLAALRSEADAVVAIPCDGLLPAHRDKSIMAAFQALDGLLSRAARSLVETVTVPGLIGIDPADLRYILRHEGCVRLGHGEASGHNAAVRAATAALASPFLGGPIATAPGIFVAVRGGEALTVGGVRAAGEAVTHAASPLASIYCGATFDHTLPTDAVEISIFAASRLSER